MRWLLIKYDGLSRRIVDQGKVNSYTTRCSTNDEKSIILMNEDINELLNKLCDVQFESLLSIYGVVEYDNEVIDLADWPGSNVALDKYYLVVQDYKGELHKDEDFYRFLRNEKPHLWKEVLINYLNTLCFFMKKGKCLYAHPAVYHDASYEFDLIEETNEQNAILYNDSKDDTEVYEQHESKEIRFTFLPWDLSGSRDYLEDLLYSIANQSVKAKTNLSQSWILKSIDEQNSKQSLDSTISSRPKARQISNAIKWFHSQIKLLQTTQEVSVRYVAI